VWRIEPLVRVGRPRIRELHAVGERTPRGRDPRPQAERTIDVQPDRPPAARCSNALADLAQRIERTAVHVAGLRAYDDRPFAAQLEPIRSHAAVAIGFDHAHVTRAETEQAQRAVDRVMA